MRLLTLWVVYAVTKCMYDNLVLKLEVLIPDGVQYLVSCLMLGSSITNKQYHELCNTRH